MEAEDKQELVKAREVLRRELATLWFISGRWRTTTGGPLPIITKLRSQLDEIGELLESEESIDPDPAAPQPRMAVLREGALLYEIDGEPLSSKRIRDE